MIAVSTTGHSFEDLVDYLFHGRTGVEHDRVAWAETHNLALPDPERAGRLMQATAAQNHRVDHPVYHLVVSFDPSDRPTESLMRHVADRLRADLGVTAHQALVVAHRDRWHAHLHIVVNRVHPDTGRAWNTWQDYPTTQRTLRTLERSLGLREVEGRLHQLPGQEAPARPLPQPPRELPSHESPPPPERRTVVAHAIDRVRELDLARHLRDLRYNAEQRVFDMSARLSRLRELHDRALTASVAFDRALGTVYVNPRHARSMFEELAGASSRDHARKSMAQDPAFFGTLRTEDRPTFFGLLHRPDDTVAYHRATDAAWLGARASDANEELRRYIVSQGMQLQRGTVDAYMAVAGHLQARLEAAAAERTRTDLVRRTLPDDRALQRAAHLAMQYLLPRELRHIALWLTAPQLALANSVRSIAADLVMGHERRVG